MCRVSRRCAIAGGMCYLTRRKYLQEARHGGKKKTFPQQKSGLHPRNRHRSRYDFPALIASCPALAPFVKPNVWGDVSVDFADPAAVKMLNRALLQHFYGIEHWDIPADYLCPPIPGRADYLHHLADLLATSNGGEIPRGKGVAILDVGVGANCIYPIVGLREYGWRFTGSEIDSVSLNAAKMIVEMNPTLRNSVRLRLQKQPELILAASSARPRNLTPPCATRRSTRPSRKRAPAPAASCINWAKGKWPTSRCKTSAARTTNCGAKAAKRPSCARWWKRASARPTTACGSLRSSRKTPRCRPFTMR